MTDNEREATIKALIDERRSPLATNNPQRLAAIDRELKQLGATGTAPAKRTERRTHGSR